MGFWNDLLTPLAEIEGSGPPEFLRRHFTIQKQQQSQWCWAAVTVSIRDYYGHTTQLSQCQLVNSYVGLTTCCANGSSSSCNQPNNTAGALAFVGHLEKNLNGSISFKAVQEQIVLDRPIGIRILWAGSGAHAIVVDGYSSSDGEQWVFGDDPGSGDCFLYTYSAFQTSYSGTGTWNATRFTTP